MRSSAKRTPAVTGNLFQFLTFYHNRCNSSRFDRIRRSIGALVSFGVFKFQLCIRIRKQLTLQRLLKFSELFDRTL